MYICIYVCMCVNLTDRNHDINLFIVYTIMPHHIVHLAYCLSAIVYTLLDGSLIAYCLLSCPILCLVGPLRPSPQAPVRSP